MFAFGAMPGRAQGIGEAIPLTFLRLVRKTILKAGDFRAIAGDLWPRGIILVALTGSAVLRFRPTLG